MLKYLTNFLERQQKYKDLCSLLGDIENDIFWDENYAFPSSVDIESDIIEIQRKFDAITPLKK